MSSQILKSFESIFCKIPKTVADNIKYLTLNNKEELQCALCNKTIDFGQNKSLLKSNLESHLLSQIHVGIIGTEENIKECLDVTFSGEIPKTVLDNMFVLGVNNKRFSCEVCKEIITNMYYLPQTEKDLCKHFLTNTHVKNVHKYNETLDKLQGVYGNIPDFISNNSEFLRLSKNGKDYLCKICEEPLKVDSNDSHKTEDHFKTHLFSFKHIKEVKQAKVFSRIPQLKEVFFYLPNYMLRSIEYFSMNGTHFFCSLCNENIVYDLTDPYETEQNFKMHCLSSDHEQYLLCRRDPKNETFVKLQGMFDRFPDLVVENLKYISLNVNHLHCSVCDEYLEEEDELDTAKHVISHCNSNFHASNVAKEVKRWSQIKKTFGNIFGGIPLLIQDNIQHIEFRDRNNFVCVLCNVTLLSREDSGDIELNACLTEENFILHLCSDGHIQRMEDIEKLSKKFQADLETVFECIPQFVFNNWENIGYKQQRHRFLELHCFLCDETVSVEDRNVKESAFRKYKTHMNSIKHIDQTKLKANRVMKTSEKLESIFGKVPNFILSNVEHIDKDHRGFLCKLCFAPLGGSRKPEMLKNKFYMHLNGSEHKSNLEDIENCNNGAMQRLNFSLWHVSEFLLRNIDYLRIKDNNNFYCILCEETLQIDHNNLVCTKQSLRYHVDSQKHLKQLK